VHVILGDPVDGRIFEQHKLRSR